MSKAIHKINKWAAKWIKVVRSENQKKSTMLPEDVSIAPDKDEEGKEDGKSALNRRRDPLTRNYFITRTGQIMRSPQRRNVYRSYLLKRRRRKA